MARNDPHTTDKGSQTLTGAVMPFDQSNIDSVIAEIRCKETLEVIAGGDDKRKFDVMTSLEGKRVTIAIIALSGDKYLASFGVIPERDFDEGKTRKDAQDAIDYLRKVFAFYA
jgi:hypothetical protein